MRSTAVLLVLGLLVVACTSSPSQPTDDALAHGIHYLQAQYSPLSGLLRESPLTQPHRYWLATDNLVAIYALRCANVPTLTATLQATYQQFGSPRHGLIEALDRQPIAWPPYVHTHTQVAALGQEQIWLEQRVSGAQMTDWVQYADLAMLNALRLHQAGERQAARQTYQAALTLWNGRGFADYAYQVDGLYASYKLALAIYVAQALGKPVPADILAALLAKQVPAGATCDAEPCAGGFYTLYDAEGVPKGDTNTETTAYAVLALCTLIAP